MKKGLLILALASALTGHANNGKEGETRTATKTMDISAGDVINILGKNKAISIETWSKNQVEIVATLNFYGDPNSRMQEFLDNWEDIVNGNIRKLHGELLIDAEIDEPNKVQIGSRYLGVQVGYSEKQLHIEYALKVPASNPIQLRTSYKKLWMEGDFSEVDISAYSSEFRGGNFKKAKLSLKYGETNIKSIGTGTLESYENDLELGNVETIEIDDKYSELIFGKVGELKIKGYETDIKADNIDRASGNLKYGNMEIGQKLGLGTFTLYEYDISGEALGNLKLENSKYSSVQFDRANEIRLLESYEDEVDVRFINILESKSKYGEFEIDELGKRLVLSESYEDDVVVRRVAEGADELSLDGKYLTLDLTMGTRAFALKADTKYGKITYDESKLKVSKYIKENDNLTLEAGAKNGSETAFKISLKGYEIKAEIN